MLEEKSVDQLVAEVKKIVDTKLDESRAAAEEIKGRAEKNEKVTEGLTQQFDEAFKAFNELKAHVEEVEQKLALRGKDEQRGPVSAGYQMIENDEVKSFMANPTSGKRVGIETKAIISSLTTDANGSAGDLVVPQRGIWGTAGVGGWNIDKCATSLLTLSCSIKSDGGSVRDVACIGGSNIDNCAALLKPQRDVALYARHRDRTRQCCSSPPAPAAGTSTGACSGT